MKYVLDEKTFKKRLVELGFKNCSDFASKSKIHRNTLLQFLNGKDVFSHAFTKLAAVIKTDPMELLISYPSLEHDIINIQEIQNIISWLHQNDKNLAIFLLGSRAKGIAKEFSDWDIGIFRYPKKLTGIEFLRLKRRVEDQSENLIRLVDLVNLNQAPKCFLENLTNGKILFLEGNIQTYHYFIGVLDGIQKGKAA